MQDHHAPISTGGRSTCSLQFAYNIDLMGGSDGKVQNLTSRLIDRARAYGMEVSTEKSKIMTNSMNSISADINVNRQK